MRGSTSKRGTWWRTDMGGEMLTWHLLGHDQLSLVMEELPTLCSFFCTAGAPPPPPAMI